MELIRELKPKGVFIIPKDIREQAKIREGEKLAVSVRDGKIIIRKQQSPEEWLTDFLKYRKIGKGITLKDIKRYEEESYDLP